MCLPYGAGVTVKEPNETHMATTNPLLLFSNSISLEAFINSEASVARFCIVRV